MKTEREKWNTYIAPQVEIIEVTVEKGFAASVSSGEGVYGDDSQGGFDRP